MHLSNYNDFIKNKQYFCDYYFNPDYNHDVLYSCN